MMRWQRQPAFGGAPFIKSGLVGRDVARNLAATRNLDETATNLDLRLQAGVALSGYVQDAEGRPLANAAVSLNMVLHKADEELDQTRTDAQGSFTFKGLPREGDYHVSVSASGYGSVGRVAAQRDGTQSNKLQLPPIKLLAANLQLAGKVVGPDGKPVSGLWVNGAGGNAQTDAEGRFVFKKVAPGTVYVSAFISGTNRGPSLVGTLRAEAGDTNVVIQLSPFESQSARARVTTGTVFGPSGAPAPGVSLSVLPSMGTDLPIKSDANGRFTLKWEVRPARTDGLPAKSWLLGRDAAHHLASIVELTASTTNLDLRLRAALTLSGSVRDTEGKPVTNAVLYLAQCPDGAQTRSFLERLNTLLLLERLDKLDEQGSFSFSALPQGVRYNLGVIADGYGTADQDVSAYDTRTANLQLPAIVLKIANLQLAGRVIGLDGKPSWGAHVALSVDGQPPSMMTQTTADGRFMFKQVCEGAVEVRAQSPPGSGLAGIVAGTVQAHAGDTNVVVKLVSSDAARIPNADRNEPSSAKGVPAPQQP